MIVPAYPTPRNLLKDKTVVVTAAAGTGIGFAVAKRAAELMGEGGAMLTLTYGGSVRLMPNYNVRGVAKAAFDQHYIAFATNYFGFDSDAEIIASVALSGRFRALESFTERQVQGMVNQLLAMRMMRGRIATDGLVGDG